MSEKGNQILLTKRDGSLGTISTYEGLAIEFRGENSVIALVEGSVFASAKIVVGSQCKVEIGKTNPRGLRGLTVDMSGHGKNKTLYIADGCSCESMRLAMANESNLAVSFGKNCLISSNVTIRPTDGHVIFEIGTKRIINRSRPIAIGDNVWIGASVTVLKGSSVPSNTIVGTGTVVAGTFNEENTIIAGCPAKVVKHGVMWDRKYIESFEGVDFYSLEE